MRERNLSRVRRAAALLAAGAVFQLSGCDFGQITVSQTINANDLVISVIRGAILDPIDAFVTAAVDNALGTNQ